MKNVIYLFIYLSIYSCKAQKLNSENSDIILLNPVDTAISVYDQNYSSTKSANNIILSFPINEVPSPKRIILYDRNKKDTMSILCYCNYRNIIFMDSLPFKKGNYELNIISIIRQNRPKKGKDIFNLKIKSLYNSNIHYVNLKDTASVKLTKIK